MKKNESKIKLTKKELEHLYYEENLTLQEMCNVIGVKSPITVARALHKFNINTNKNQTKSNITKKGMSDDEFKKYLINLYKNELLSINQIARMLNVTPGTIRKYFKKYNIEFRETKNAKTIAESGSRNPNWKGGKITRKKGYIQIYMPNHPYCDKLGYVYEHRLVMEKHIGRYLKKDEVVHHIDFNKHNNNISNLIILTPQEHTRLHKPHKKKGDGLNANS